MIMKRVTQSFGLLFVLLSIVRVALPLTLPHLKIFYGEGHRNLPNPLEIVKSFIPRPGCGIHCNNRDDNDQEQRGDNSFYYQNQHNSDNYHGHPQYQPNPNWIENHRPHQTYGVPFENNWQNSQNSQQNYIPPNNVNQHFPSNIPQPGQPHIIETGYNPSEYQNYRPKIPFIPQNAPEQQNIRGDPQIFENNYNPSMQNLPNVMQPNYNPSWQSQPQIDTSNSNPTWQNEQLNASPSSNPWQSQPQIDPSNSSPTWQNQPVEEAPSSNPWQNQPGMFDSNFSQSNGPNIKEITSGSKLPNPAKFEVTPPTSNQANIMNVFFHLSSSTSAPIQGINEDGTQSKQPPSINPGQETKDFIYPDSAQYIHKPMNPSDSQTPLIDIRRR